MMLARVLPQMVAKEVRALQSVWLAGLASLVVLGAVMVNTSLGTGRTEVLWVLTYVGASVALGALSVGHEYQARMLDALLAQPVSRARIFLVKQAVVAMMLLTLAGVIFVTAPGVTGDNPAFIVAFAVLGGLFVAPWLTMLSRNPLAGTLFTVVLPGLLWLFVVEIVPERLRFVVFWSALPGLSTLAAVLGWRTFMRLEAIEGPAAAVGWPAAAAGPAAARRRHPMWLLVKKELGLQQLTFAVSGVYLVSWATVMFQARLDWLRDDLFGAMTFVYSGLLALLIGSLASAEERHLNTSQWQLLLPVASWKQWLVKAGTAFGLAMLLAVALPALVIYLADGHVAINEWYACAILLLTAVSLYVSSLSTSGVKALFLSVPVSLFVVFPAIALLSRLGWVELTPPRLGLFAVTIAVLLYFALVNHRSAERGVWRICVQVFWIAGCFAFCTVVAAIVATSA